MSGQTRRTNSLQAAQEAYRKACQAARYSERISVEALQMIERTHALIDRSRSPR